MREMDGVSLGVGGTLDHVHLLIGLKSSHCLANVIRDLKRNSSLWAPSVCKGRFLWQEGYAAFTLSPSAIEGVRRYLANQEEHHRKQPYLEELTTLLTKARLKFDPKYLE